MFQPGAPCAPHRQAHASPNQAAGELFRAAGPTLASHALWRQAQIHALAMFEKRSPTGRPYFLRLCFRSLRPKYSTTNSAKVVEATIAAV